MGQCANTVTKGQTRCRDPEIAEFARRIPAGYFFSDLTHPIGKGLLNQWPGTQDRRAPILEIDVAASGRFSRRIS